MGKVKIKLVTIGKMPLHLNLSRVTNWKSEVFQLVGDIDRHALRCASDIQGWSFSDSLLKQQLPKHQGADFLVAVVNVPIENNWYARRLGDNQVVFTFHQIRNILSRDNIPIENAIIRALYGYTLVYHRSGNRIPGLEEVPSFSHDETRGCLFDMNGIKRDLVESSNKPVICSECEERLFTERVSEQTIRIVQKEIRDIHKPLYFRALDFVKVRPIVSLVISSLFAIALGTIGSLIASYIYDGIKSNTTPVKTNQTIGTTKVDR